MSERLLTVLRERNAAFAMSAHDAISAIIAEEAGFPALWASSLTVSAARGYRDNGELPRHELLDAVRAMTRRVRLPVLVDAGTGCAVEGGLAELAQALEHVGAAGLCLEDQRHPKVNALLGSTAHALAPVSEMCARIATARRAAPEIVVVARTEALIVGASLDEALARARAYVDAGAHAILVHSKAGTVEQVAQFARAWTEPTPLICVPTTYPDTSHATFAQLGFGLVIWANQSLRAAVAAMQGFARSLAAGGAAFDVLAPLPEIFRLSGDARDAPRVRHAIILAAGMGTRLGELGSLPKGFLEVDGETLIDRSVQVLRRCGIETITLVVGYEARHYEAFASSRPDVRLVRNPQYASHGSLRSLQCGLEGVSEPCLVLESDLYYEERAIAAVLASPHDDALLASGKTNAGDEVWLRADRDRLVGLSKDADALAHLPGEIAGELVGITKLSASAGAVLRTLAATHVGASYDTDGLMALARERALHVLVEPELLWGEVDDIGHLRRVREVVAPALRQRETAFARGERS